MSDFLQRMKSAAKADKKTIVLPEGEDPRTIEAAKKIVEEGLANLIILGDPSQIDVEGVTVIDPKTAEIIMQLTDRIVREKKLTALMVTHNLRYALEYGDRLIMMHQGGIVLDKAGEEKQAVQMDDILKIFNEISIECGN